MDYESFLKKFPIELNRQQKEAVQAVNGPVLLLAVPGSGKTTVLVARLGYMIYCQGIQPENILTLTYTVAATNDMRKRFCRFFGDELGQRMEFRTINSICAGIIKYYGNQIGKEPYGLETDEKVLLGILSVLYQKYEEEFPTESDLKGIKTYITYIKNMMLSVEEIRALEKEAGCHLLEIYQEYCSQLKKRKCMDYDDQMVYAYRLLRSSPKLLQHYQQLYPYVCVDEAQDTSKIQHEIVSLLVAEKKNIFMVGDEDQSIYGFRAAYPKALLSFEKQYKGAKILLMEENFRSNANIVEAADGFIQKNSLRHEKHMKAVKARTSDIKEIILKSRSSQYSYLLKAAQNCREQTAVLYRDNESAIPLVDLLEREEIPYRIRNGELSFFTHRIVVDIQNIMRFANDMKNADLFECIYYKISTYLSKQMAMEACEISREYHISIFSAIFGYLELKPHTIKNLKALETHFHHMRNENPKKVLNRIISYMGYGDYMERMGLSNTKISILKMIAEREETLVGFLTRMEELKDIFQKKESQEESLFILSTIHGSKGLEYDHVYLIDVLDGIFPEEVPHDLKKIGKEELEVYEEERRLFYVGVTRAKQNLYLFRTQNPSSFVTQLLPKKNLEKKVRKKTETKANVFQIKQAESSEKEFREFCAKLTKGVTVKHIKFGEGVVMAIDKENVTVLFGKTKRTFQLQIVYRNGLLKEC